MEEEEEEEARKSDEKLEKKSDIVGDSQLCVFCLCSANERRSLLRSDDFDSMQVQIFTRQYKCNDRDRIMFNQR